MSGCGCQHRAERVSAGLRALAAAFDQHKTAALLGCLTVLGALGVAAAGAGYIAGRK